MRRVLSITFILLVGFQLSAFGEEGQPPLEIFNQRILPIFRSENPSSCIQCHLSSVDLKNYILPSHEQTFVSLRDQGLIDVDQPEASKILHLIAMGEKDLDKGARLIHAKTRQQEREAFSAWVKACCADPSIRDLPAASDAAQAGPEVPVEVIRHTRKSRVVESFARNVWSQRIRCFPCHVPQEIDSDNPRHQGAIKTQKQMLEKYGEEGLRRLHLFRETPEETLAFLIERSRNPREDELPMLNLEHPRKSLLVLKPMSKLPAKVGEKKFAPPSSLEPVTHMGGLKMHKDDQSYKSFVAWIEDYASVVEGSYASVEDLPHDNWYPTQHVLKLSKAPEAWPVGTPVQMFVYPWDKEQETWTKEAVAFTQGTVTPRKLVNGALFVLGGDEPESTDRRRELLAGGRYRVKVYADTESLLEHHPSMMLGSDQYAGQVEFTQSRWREGFRTAPMVAGDKLTQ